MTRPGITPSSIRRRTARLLGILAAIGLLSCSHTRDDSTPLTAASVIDLVEKRNAQVLGVQAQGSVSIETPELSNSGSIELKLLKPDSLLFEIFGPFGLRVAKGFVTADSFTFYNGLDNTVARGATNATALRSLLHVSLDFRTLLEILSGTLGFGHRNDGATITGTKIENGFRIVSARAGETAEYDVDPAYEAVTRYSRKDASGRIIEEVTFKDFRKKQGLFFPTIVSIARPTEDENVRLVYDQLFVNELPMDFSFSYPKSAMSIRL